MIKTLMIGTAGLALAFPVTAPAMAAGHHGQSTDVVRTVGTCSGASQWKLKVEPADTGVEVEFEVESGVAGQSWDYSLSGPAGQIVSGTGATDDRGEFEAKAETAGSVTDAFTAIATSADQTCDSTVGVLPVPVPGTQHDDDPATHEDGEDHHQGTCTADAAIDLAVKQAGANRVATLSVGGATKGQKWRYKIKSGNKIVGKGSAKAKGKKAGFKIKARTRHQGALIADAHPVDGSEQCEAQEQPAA